MTILSNRPSVGATRADESRTGGPLALTAAAAGAGAAVIGLVVCMSVALTGWFLADAGAHGDTTDALRVGAVAWLAGHGSRVVVSGVPLGVTPLAVTAVLVLIAFRAGRWAGHRATDRAAAGSARTPAPQSRDASAGAWATAVGTFGCAYVVVAVLTGVLAGTSDAEPVLGRALLGALLVAGLAGGAGLAAGSGRLAVWVSLAPAWSGEVVTAAVAGVLWLLAAAAALVGGALLVSFNEAATVLSELDLSVGDALSYTVVTALFAPNAVLFGVAYLSGPGFAFGAGTTVSPTAVSLGVVPAYPVLAALPGNGPPPGWAAALLAVPVLAAAVGAAATRRRRARVPLDLAVLRGAAAGFLGGVLVTVLVAVAGGPLGTGRLAEIGAPAAEVLVFATGLMSVGGALGGLLQGWWQRRHGGRDGETDEADAVPDDPEQTVELLR